MNTLENLLTAQRDYKRLTRIERQLIKSAVKTYQVEELVKQCSKAKLARNQMLVSLVQHQVLASSTFVGIIMIPYLTLLAF